MPLIPKKNTQKDAELNERERLQRDAQHQAQGEVSAFQLKANEIRDKYRKALDALASR